MAAYGAEAHEGLSGGMMVWSIVYETSTGEIQVAMGRCYEAVHTFSLDMTVGSP